MTLVDKFIRLLTAPVRRRLEARDRVIYTKLRQELLDSEAAVLGDFRQELSDEAASALRTLHEDLATRESAILGALRQEMTTRETAALGTLRQELADKEAAVLGTLHEGLDDVKRRFRRMSRRMTLHERAVIVRAIRELATVEDPKALTSANADSYEIFLEKMNALLPNVFPIWRSLLEPNEVAYRGLPADSCSVAGNEGAEAFGDFLVPYLRGRVLDIGCGTQSVPVYLRRYPLDLISGIDPLCPDEPHPFQFVRGFAEFLPWEDNSFEIVIAATSLDHVMSLERVFAEIRRVLTPNGAFLPWVAFSKGAAPYNTSQPDLRPVDEFHMFHFDKWWFEESVGQFFEIREIIDLDEQSHFYCLTPDEVT